MNDAEIANYLENLRREGRSSPIGKEWDAFGRHLKERGPQDAPRIPPPLILAASGESNESKHQRLREQLQWAATYGLLEEAFVFLQGLRTDEWNHGRQDSWDQSSYWGE